MMDPIYMETKDGLAQWIVYDESHFSKGKTCIELSIGPSYEVTHPDPTLKKPVK